MFKSCKPSWENNDYFAKKYVKIYSVALKN